MTCCIALAVTIAIFRSTWMFFTGRRDENVFAPVARRLAPGETHALVEATTPPREATTSRVSSARRLAAHGLFAGGTAWLVGIAAEPYVAPLLGLGCACCREDRSLYVGAGLATVFLALGLLAPLTAPPNAPKESTP